jgi:hypothetical protein
VASRVVLSSIESVSYKEESGRMWKERVLEVEEENGRKTKRRMTMRVWEQNKEEERIIDDN